MSESWARAMLIAYDRCQKSRQNGGGRRWRVYGYPLGNGRWAYAVGRPRKPPHVAAPEPIVMTDELFAHLSETLPRCAQRARFFHGGNSKVAISERRIAEAMAKHVGQRVFRCDLPAPAIGPHFHLSSGLRR